MKRNSLKTTLKKALVSLLVATMLIPTLASCSDTKDIQDTIIPVYTFYGIKGEGTTDEAIRAVELAINRILISRYTLAVDFRLFTENEYEAALNAAIEEAEKYESTNDTTEVSTADGELPPYTYTEDSIIAMLESGKDFELQSPRVDVILCKDSAHYFTLANSNKLVGIDTPLTNEGKILSEYIHPSLFALAKIGRKTFGVPNNTALGEYEYIVFDKQYLDEHKYDYKTMKTLEDLEDYLALIKEKNADVVPLKKAGTPTYYEYLFGENSPYYVAPATDASGALTGRIYGTLDTDEFSYIIEEYATLLGKYHSLGYLKADSDENEKYAVTFLKGTPADIEALEKETGREYEYMVYKTPVATTESLDTVYSISSTVSTTEITTLIDIIVAIFTDEQIKNYFLYGIQGEHYIVDDNNFIQPIKNEESGKFDYVMKNEYTGNVYLAKPKQGDDTKVYEYMKEINLAASLSLTSGFSYVPKTYKVKDVTLVEPNYVEMMGEIVGEAVSKLADGTYGFVDFDEFKVTVEAELLAYANDTVAKNYSDSLINAYIEKNAAYLESEEFLSQIHKEATDLVNDNLVITSQTALSIELKKTIKEEMPNATSQEIEAEIQARLTDELIQEYISTNYTEADINLLVENRKKILLDNAKSSVSKSYQESAEFLNAVSAYKKSNEYKTLVDAMIAAEGDNYVENKYLKKIEKQITAQADAIHASAVEAIQNAIKEFNTKAIETFGWTDEEAEKNLDVQSYTDFIQYRLEAQYYSVYKDPDATT